MVTLSALFITALAAFVSRTITSRKRQNWIVENLFAIYICTILCTIVSHAFHGPASVTGLAAMGFGVLVGQAVSKVLADAGGDADDTSPGTAGYNSTAAHTSDTAEDDNINKPSSNHHNCNSARDSSPSGCQTIIKATYIPGTDIKNQLAALESRAGPNERLVHFFGIENCFTSTDPAVCKAFRAKVEKLLYIEEDDWRQITGVARGAAVREFNGCSEEHSLVGVVQTVTMKAMLFVLFGMDTRKRNDKRDSSIRNLAHQINVQWLRSKTDSADTSDQALNDALRAVFPDWNEDDAISNPLNLILPGYETMWRVVLRCFLEVTVRGHANARDWRKALRGFSFNPGRDGLFNARAAFMIHAKEEDATVIPAHVIQEALRLYPPTRDAFTETLKTAAESVPELPPILKLCSAGPIRYDRDAHFMPFGTSPFACPAKREKGVPVPFGLAMIGLLVGVLVDIVGSAWVVEADLPDLAVPLDTDRDAYSDAKFVRRERLDGM